MNAKAPPLLPALTWAAQFFFWMLVIGLFAFAVSGCSTFGIATESYVETRVADIAEATNTVIPAPPPSPEIPPWVQIAMAALGVPISIGATNHIRDKARRQRSEAVSVAEARAKGYHLDGAVPVG